MGPDGSVPGVASDASDTDAETILTGIAANPDAALACGNGGVCGVAPYFPDAGDAAASDGSISDAASVDDGPTGPCHPCGVVVRPDE